MEDWYIEFGGGRNWEDAHRYGFVSGGGGAWYSRSLKRVPEGSRIFVNAPGHGYVGVGVTTGPAERADRAVIGGARFRNLPLTGTYVHPDVVGDLDPHEYVVPVRWILAVPEEDGVWEKGFYASQHTAVRAQKRLETIDRVPVLLAEKLARQEEAK